MRPLTAILLLACVVAMGCEARFEHSPVPWSANRIGHMAYEATLPDGTHCAYVLRGGITCDWEAKR